MLPKFKNVTTNLSEPICLSDKFKVSDGCLIKEQNLDKIPDYDNALKSQEKEWAELTLGCRKCNNTGKFYGIVEKNPATGIITQSCFDTKNQTGQENDLCGTGKIKRWEGLIPEKQTLYCRDCSEVIPNCMACTKTTDCDMCKLGYRRAIIKDA